MISNTPPLNAADAKTRADDGLVTLLWICVVPPFRVRPPVPSAATFPTISLPEFTVVPPLKVLAPLRVCVPVPWTTRAI